jgi:hypothetical protein
MTDIARPVGLVPGTREFFHEVTATKARQFLDAVLDHASPENPSPQALRAVALVMERTDPTVSAVHHTIETKTSKMSTEELKAKLAEILGRNMGREAETVECRDIVQSPEVYADIVNETVAGDSDD